MASSERLFPETTTLISVTDLQGDIQYCNRDFVEISGFKEEELLSSHHNIVRHPDMPKAAFADLWATIKADKPWQGLVKNRCKNGDYYWVDAYVTPVYQQGKKVGYQSVRSCPTRKQVERAAKLYQQLQADPTRKLPSKSLMQSISLEAKVNALLGLGLLAVILSLIFAGGPLAWAFNLCFTVVFIALVALINLGVLKRIPQLTKIIRRISTGDLTENIRIPNDDTIGVAFASAKMLQGRMKAIVGRFSESVDSLEVSSDVLADAAYKTEKSMNQQNTETDMVATAMNEMSATVAEVAQNTIRTSELAGEADSVAVNGQQVVGQTRETISQLATDISGISTTVNTLAADCQAIKDITQTINSIAEQTNLLALNAAIEAARAGETGRGFAVVADEVRVLASRTQNSTVEIDSMIEKLQVGSQQAVQATEHGLAKVNNCVEQIQQTDDSFGQIVNSVTNVNDMNTQIATAAEEQSAVAEEMNANVQSISEQAGKTVANMSSLDTRITSIKQMTTTLKAQLQLYDFGEPTSHFDFNKAKQAHLNWKARVRDLLNGNEQAITQNQLCSHRECELGKWYYSVGKKAYGDSQYFQQIEAPHERLHQIVELVYQSHSAGDNDEADKLYDELAPLSEKIVGLLDQTEKSVR